MHTMGAIYFKTPELMLTEEESSALGKAITTVTELYDVPILDEKTQAWVGLGICLATIYGPRFVAVRNNRKKKSTPKVVQFTPQAVTL